MYYIKCFLYRNVYCFTNVSIIIHKHSVIEIVGKIGIKWNLYLDQNINLTLSTGESWEPDKLNEIHVRLFKYNKVIANVVENEFYWNVYMWPANFYWHRFMCDLGQPPIAFLYFLSTCWRTYVSSIIIHDDSTYRHKSSANLYTRIMWH